MKTTPVFLSLLLLSSQAQAWETPSQAIAEFLKFELNGGRLTGEHWQEYTTQYVAAPAGYDEPGWDEATVVASAKVTGIRCAAQAKCSAQVRFVLHPTKNLGDTSVVPHEKGGNMLKKYLVVKTEGTWRIEPSFGAPIISIDAYNKHRAKQLLPRTHS